jgi:peptide-methionine (S)-S-oxide reductase
MEKAIFAGGCFWCTEAVFKVLKGVIKVTPGYSGGSREDALYPEVSSGKTKHAEVVMIEFDPKHISYKKLLDIFFASHDPTSIDRQGNDIGSQYRSIIFYTDQIQKEEALKHINELNSESKYDKPIVTKVEPFVSFYEAEDYHKNYFETHPENLYCDLVINPKVSKIKKEFEELLNN